MLSATSQRNYVHRAITRRHLIHRLSQREITHRRHMRMFSAFGIFFNCQLVLARSRGCGKSRKRVPAIPSLKSLALDSSTLEGVSFGRRRLLSLCLMSSMYGSKVWTMFILAS